MKVSLVSLGVAALLGVTGPARAQVAYSGSVHFLKSPSATGDSTGAFYLFNSVDVTHGRLRVTATLPVVSQEFVLVDPLLASSRSWESGVGDPTLRVDVLAGRRGGPVSVSLGGAVKFPVADAASGLGSGEFDAAVGITVFGGRGRQTILADVSYWFVGDAADLPQRDVPAFYVGYGVGLGSSYRWSAILSLSSSPSIVAGLAAPTQVGLGMLWAPRPRLGLGAAVGIGLTDTAGDLSVSTSWRIGF